jgi:type VI secretion system protein ImpJ
VSKKPVWSEGLLLSQHHLQQQDLYQEGLLRERLRSVAHYDWGISELEVDERGFAAGEFRLRKLSAIWPDGTLVACGEGSEQRAPAPRALPSDGVRVDVLLGLALDGPSVASVGDERDASVRRFVRATRQVVDINSGGSAQEIEWARPNLHVLFGSERSEGYSTIRIAELHRQENGQFKVLDTYIPPVTCLQAAPFLHAGVRRTLAGLVARQQQLAAERRQRQAGAVDFHATEVRKFWLLQTLNRVIPLLTHLLDTPRAHPEEAYVALAQLAGELCSFSSDTDPSVVPKFNFLELGEVFESLFAVVLRLLPGGIERPYVEIGLEHRQDGMFIGRFADRALLGYDLFVAVRSTIAEALVRERVPAVLKVASWNQVYEVVKQARRGVPVEIDWNPSSALPVKPGVCFFALRKEGPHWDDIQQSASVALYLPIDPEWSGASLSLYAVPKAETR